LDKTKAASSCKGRLVTRGDFEKKNFASSVMIVAQKSRKCNRKLQNNAPNLTKSVDTPLSVRYNQYESEHIF
jgi:hypothetical protein